MAWVQWQPYVPVAQRRLQAAKKMAALRQKGADIHPVKIDGRKIVRTFWGESWCGHLGSFSDYANRLPRGGTYVRNGSVCHLAVGKGRIEAKVSGSEIYDLSVKVKTLPATKWSAFKRHCRGQVGSLLELLQGRLSDQIMSVVTDRDSGLFPLPREISLNCNCPDWAVMCKHVAAVLYGVGARLDERPELLFRLRGVDHEELIDTDAEAVASMATKDGKSKRLASGDLADVFGISIDAGEAKARPGIKPKKKAKKRKGSARRAAESSGRKKKGGEGRGRQSNCRVGRPTRRGDKENEERKEEGRREK